MTDKDARHRALAEVKGYLARSSPLPVQLVSAGSEQRGQLPNSSPDSTKGRVRAYLDMHPELTQQSINQVWAALQTSGVIVGRTTVAEVLQERRKS
jgi:hypothetical protein